MSIFISAHDRYLIERFLDGWDAPTIWFRRSDGSRLGFQVEAAYPREEGGCRSVPMRSNKRMATENVVLRCRMLLARHYGIEKSELEFFGAT